jgi:class 3 adenylate cyclase
VPARNEVAGGPDTIVRRGAIVIVDNAGFTARMLTAGAPLALQDVWTTRRTLIPLFREEGGEVYKVDADNLYVFFDEISAAVGASQRAHRAMAELTLEHRLRVSIGIGFGELYYVSSEDEYYGPEVNLASKLGEDIAAPEETLITEAASAAIPARSVRLSRLRSILIGGVRIRYRRVES